MAKKAQPPLFPEMVGGWWLWPDAALVGLTDDTPWSNNPGSHRVLIKAWRPGGAGIVHPRSTTSADESIDHAAHYQCQNTCQIDMSGYVKWHAWRILFLEGYQPAPVFSCREPDFSALMQRLELAALRWLP